MHEEKVVGKVVIGSLKGNSQGLGKDIVAAALRAAGFRVVDLGVDVSPQTYADAALKEKAKIIAISISIDKTVRFLKDVVNHLRQRNLRNKVKVIIGGQAVSEQTCKEYCVDTCAKDAQDCVEKVKRLIGASQRV